MTVVTVVSLGGVDMVTDFPGDLVGDLVAHRLGDLVALPLHVLLADGGVAVTDVSGLGRPLANVSKADADRAVVSHSVASVASVDKLAGLANNSGAVVHLLAGLLAVLGHDVLALLDVGRVHHHVVFLVALLVVHVVALLVMDHIVNNVALGVAPVVAGGGVGEGGPGEEECGTQLGHNPEYLFPPTLLRGS